MVKRIHAPEFVALARQIPTLDVRSPSEYEQGHIPGAISMPLFSDEERAEVGTLYKQVGQAAAMERGLQIVGPKIQELFQKGAGSAADGRLQVYCWRGGKRSESVAALLAMNGLQVTVLEKGYKNFRKWVLETCGENFPVRIVGGKTGSGKTKILGALRAQGAQVVDLEALADHRGSAFGRLGMERSVSQTQFENDLAMQLAKVDKNKLLYVEDESRNIGRLVIPEPLWVQMRAAVVCYVDLPMEERIRLLMEDYGAFSIPEIISSLQKIEERLGGLRFKQAMEAAEEGDAPKVIELTLEYYDKSYFHGLGKRPPSNIRQLECKKFDAEKIAARILDIE
jgi:tRNA 2-selenouridine synthase